LAGLTRFLSFSTCIRKRIDTNEMRLNYVAYSGVVDVVDGKPKNRTSSRNIFLHRRPSSTVPDESTMPARFAHSQQYETRFQASSDADRFLAPSFALFTISETSEVKDMACRSAWGSANSRKSYRRNLSSLGNHSSLDQLHAADQHVSSKNKAGMNRPQSPTTSMVDDDSWGFYEEGDDVYNQ
jgi:hypothetical protein